MTMFNQYDSKTNAKDPKLAWWNLVGNESAPQFYTALVFCNDSFVHNTLFYMNIAKPKLISINSLGFMKSM